MKSGMNKNKPRELRFYVRNVVPHNQQMNQLLIRTCARGPVPVIHRCGGITTYCYTGDSDPKGVPVGKDKRIKSKNTKEESIITY